MKTNEILSSSKPKQKELQSCLETSTENSRSVVKSYSSAPRSIKQNPRDRTLDLPFFFCYKHLTSLKNLSSAAPSESFPYWFQSNFVMLFVLVYCLREFLLSAFANRFELRCEPKQLMLLYYKICPCCFSFSFHF